MSGRATHVVAYDPEEYNVREIMKAEERRERAGEDMERTYFKTSAVVDVTAEDDAAASDGGDDNNKGAAAGSPPKKRNILLLH